MVEGQQQHARAEQDGRRRRGDEGQALERVGDRQIRRELDLADPRARVERDVLRHVERLEPQVVSVASDRRQVRRVGAHEAGVVSEAEFHTTRFSRTETWQRTGGRPALGRLFVYRAARAAFTPSYQSRDLLPESIDGPPISSHDRAIPIRKQAITKITIVFTAP